MSFSTSSFFFKDTSTTEIYTLSLHDALPISENPARAEFLRELQPRWQQITRDDVHAAQGEQPREHQTDRDRKSTRLNSSHTVISYAVFCLKKKRRMANGLNRICCVITNYLVP